MNLRQEIDDVDHDLNQAREAFLRALDTDDQHDPETGISRDDLLRHMYSQLAEAMRLHNLPENWTGSQVARIPLPRLACFLAGQIVEDAVNGRRSEAIEHLYFGTGRPGRSALQGRTIEIAIRFLAAVDAGVIQQRRSNELIAREFSVTERTVQRWSAAMRFDRERQAATYRTLRDTKPENAHRLGKMLRHQLAENGERYRNSRPHNRPKQR